MDQHQDNPAGTRSPLRLIGLLCVICAFVINADSLGFFLSDNQDVGSPAKRQLIFVFQLGLGVVGLVLLLGFPKLPQMGALRGIVALGLLVAAVVGGWGTMRQAGYFMPELERKQLADIERMIMSESVHLKLTPRFKKLGMAARNLQIPSGGVKKILRDTVQVADLSGAAHGEPDHTLDSVGTKFEHWPVEKTTRGVPLAELDFLRPFLDEVEYIENAKFGFVAGDFDGDDLSRWVVNGYFKAVVRMKSGTVAKAKSNLVAGWQLDEDADPTNEEHMNDAEKWKLDELRLLDFKLIQAPTKFFDEVLAEAVPDASALEMARHNENRDILLERLQAEMEGKDWEPPHVHWDYRAAWCLPAVSVVDVDDDGFDDFYKMSQKGKNQLFRNRGDGTFEEVAEELGLGIDDYTNVALFADFDNDGDRDVFLGRSLAASKFMENQDGRFVERTQELMPQGASYFTSTASATDYDLDGLLDLYVSTYGAQATIKEMNQVKGGKKPHGKLLDDYLPDEHAAKLYELTARNMEHHIHDRVGPPNLLMRNVGGGRLELVEDTPLLLYRNTFQATWADYDADGDPDVYAANDFALNNMFRNDGAVFVDVTEETDSGDVGFGMGASWGDYDRDGDQDLYVSNMFSKAGNRIIDRVTGVDPRFKDMAAGNSLLELADGRFTRVSTKDDSGMMVEVGGWSWGSQFVDVDNDSWLDLYTLNGYYSAPIAFRDDVDL